MQEKYTQSQNGSEGNVLWFILVAIVLIGSLTMVLSRSGSNIDQSADVEQYRIKASQIMRYTKGVEAAVQEMRMRGVSENDISFEHDATNVNANCSEGSCMVFDVDGGGLTYSSPPSGVNDGSEWVFTAANNVGTTANPVGTTAARSGNDLIMLLADMNENLCIQINRDLDVGTAGTLPEDSTGIATTVFDGTYPSSLSLIDGDPTPFELDGVTAGCFTDTNASPDIIYFYAVILAR